MFIQKNQAFDLKQLHKMTTSVVLPTNIISIVIYAKTEQKSKQILVLFYSTV